MQRKLYFLIVLLFCFTKVDAQHNLVEQIEDLIQVGVVVDEILLNKNNSIICQDGNENNIIVSQEPDGLLNNTIFSVQIQTANQAGISQQGSGHVTLLMQNGSRNAANSCSVGSNTITEVWQIGSRNTINSYIENEGVFSKSAFLNQLGDVNTLEVALLGNGDMWFKQLPKIVDAIQIGNGNNLELILDHSVLPGIKVTQTGGMSLIIKQSDFNFWVQ